MTPLAEQPVVTAEEMRAAERRAIADGTSVDALMLRAGDAVAEQVRRLAVNAEVLVLCGPGNNGGDGYVAASTLRLAGHSVRVAATGEPQTDAARAARARWAGPVEVLGEAAAAPIVVDALFGVGLSRALDEATAGALRRLVGAAQLAIAVDVPSGVSSDDGGCLGDVPTFHLTLALGAAKPAHVLQPAAARCGAVRVLDIGVSAESRVRVSGAPRLRAPGAESHKYSRGLVAVVAGAMPGAAALCATAAARSGAGYVLLLGSATDRLPHAVVRRRFAPEALGDNRVGAVVVGPGLGRDDTARERLEAVLGCGKPLVIDGDALHLLHGRTLPASSILTPHGGEFVAMFGDTGGSKIARALAAARASGAVVVFKGADTVIAAPDGRAIVHPGGTGWLATAGTGDVLAGVIAARLAGGADAFDAAATGVWLHAEAARLAGPAFVADDLSTYLPAAIGICL
jgi:hydroxyethylthiazole kinase-like uncharacterized protein yjeF